MVGGGWTRGWQVKVTGSDVTTQFTPHPAPRTLLEARGYSGQVPCWADLCGAPPGPESRPPGDIFIDNDVLHPNRVSLAGICVTHLVPRAAPGASAAHSSDSWKWKRDPQHQKGAQGAVSEGEKGMLGRHAENSSSILRLQSQARLSFSLRHTQHTH